MCKHCGRPIFLDRNGAWRHYTGDMSVVHSIWCPHGENHILQSAATPSSGAVVIYEEKIA